MFRGTGVALVTPFLGDESVDYPALEQIIDHVIEGGVDYLVALGTTGETPTLTAAEKKAVLAFILEKAKGRVPVVAGVGGNNTKEVVAQVQELPAGVAGILSVSPYYNKPAQSGIFAHFAAIAEATELPIILYNVPGRTAGNMLPGTTLRLANAYKNIVAIKEASGNIAQCMELVQHKPEGFAVLSGDDNLVLAQMAVGMDGVISVAANAYTKDFTGMVNAALAGNYDEARRLHYRLLSGMDLLFADGNPAGVKYVLSLMGICKNVLRLPLVPVSDQVASNTALFLNTLQ
jgi:4-hydroxy-tetrahydrodipicolinate synthase